jgi:hypothetical protein
VVKLLLAVNGGPPNAGLLRHVPPCWPGWFVMKSVPYYRVVVPVVVGLAADEEVEVLMKMLEIPGEVEMFSSRAVNCN